MWRSPIRRSFALIPTLALLVAACGDSKSEKAPPPVAENEASRIVPALDPPGMPRLRDSTLFELRYPASELAGGWVKLHAGEWRDSAGGNAREAYLTMIAHGDLNGDSLRDAAVILYTDPGSAGKFFDVVPVMASTTNQPEVLGGTVGHGAFIGDRVKPESLWIDGHRVWLRIMEHAKGDDECCPTLWQQRTYRLVKDSLKLETTIPLGPHD